MNYGDCVLATVNSFSIFGMTSGLPDGYRGIFRFEQYAHIRSDGSESKIDVMVCSNGKMVRPADLVDVSDIIGQDEFRRMVMEFQDEED